MTEAKSHIICRTSGFMPKLIHVDVYRYLPLHPLVYGCTIGAAAMFYKTCFATILEQNRSQNM